MKDDYNKFVTLKRNPNYKVNKNGQVLSIGKNKILSPKVSHDDYLRIQLWRDGKCEYVAIHILVAETFLDKPDYAEVVNHKDGNKQNNIVDNLEWVTQSENIKHAFRTGLSHRQINGKLSKKIDQYDLQGNYIKTWESTMEIERQLKICHGGISKACKHKYSTKNGRKSNELEGFLWEYNNK